jgi:hypothetical protein
VAGVDIGGSLREDEGMRQGFVVGALVVTAIACGSFAADVPASPPAGADGGGADAIVDGPVNHDAPALDASCINGGLRFDGDDWLAVPDNDVIEVLNGAFTVEAWVAVDAPVPPAPVQTHVLAHRDPMNFGAYDFVIDEMLHPGLRVFASNGGAALTDSPATVSPTVLTHVAITYDPEGDVSIYVNGMRSPSTAAPYKALGNASGDLLIGGSSREPTEGFRGLIDEVRISRGIVYPANFARPMKQLEVDPATTIALWHFDDGMGLMAADFGPRKLTATMPSTKANQPKWEQIACVSQLPPP